MSSPTLPQIAALISMVDPNSPEDLVALRDRLGDTDLSEEDLNAVRALAALDRAKMGDTDPSRAIDAVFGVSSYPQAEWPDPILLGPPDPEPVPLDWVLPRFHGRLS